ncbi:MAG: polyprenyl diphosphate synthase [Patescibacteria group bacterium]
MDGVKTIGFIMDGNRRWAHSRGLPTLEGHRAGFEKLKEVARWSKDAGVGTTIFYAFSTENWNRAKEEVGYLMELFEWALVNEFKKIMEEDARVLFIGDRARFSTRIQELMVEVEQGSATNKSGNLVIAVSYGGRAEIVAAASTLQEQGLPLTEENFSKALWTGDIDHPDLVLRTGGEMRLSNFMPWQSTYSELFFSPTLWPDYTKEEFEQLLAEFATRRRRFGK